MSTTRTTATATWGLVTAVALAGCETQGKELNVVERTFAVTLGPCA